MSEFEFPPLNKMIDEVQEALERPPITELQKAQAELFAWIVKEFREMEAKGLI